MLEQMVFRVDGRNEGQAKEIWELLVIHIIQIYTKRQRERRLQLSG